MPRILNSNGHPIPFVSDFFEPLKEFEFASTDEKLLESTFYRDGVLLLRNLLDRESVLQLRNYYLSLYNGENSDLAHGQKGHPAYEFVRSKTYLEFVEWPVFKDISKLLTNSRAIKRLKRSIVREYTKGSNVSSCPHRDLAYLDDGSEKAMTFWIPLGDCTLASGGLVYLENSCKRKVGDARKYFPQFKNRKWITDDLYALAQKLDRKWLFTNYCAGDVVIHSSSIIHATLDCQSDYQRISTDIRFLEEDQLSDPRWCDYWAADDGY